MNASINLTKHLLTQTTSPNKFLKLASCIRNAHTLIQVGSNPLEVLRSTSEKRNLCDVEGKRRPGAYWVFGMSSNGMDDGVAPNLRTVGLQQITKHGIDYVTRKHDSSSSSSLPPPQSILYTMGKYKPGETMEQWRGEGYSQELGLQEILDCVPHYTIVEMIASQRGRLELQDEIKEEPVDERTAIHRRTRFMELVQRTRVAFENGDIDMEEIEQSLSAYRYIPNRMERMMGGSDHIMWDRWEWKHDGDDWLEPRHLLPY
uniref:Uncharacterized protein n=2 Tax=Ditylum brightwellii TaxID=49249 RepID=A0A7S4VZY1_9STRA|mmetsp:Transcript_44276/g.66745  ORF Transcript_44276/g.66745 Transcript_44276/m.66745 type:complete len:260 (+) Transcript_44276:134-913(+)